MTTYPRLQLNSGHDRRVQKGHLWIFSNEVNVAATPLKNFTPGALVTLLNQSQQVLGVGYINPNCLLCVRILSHQEQIIDESFFVKRFQSALSLRTMLYATPYYRLVFGESDGLPGLIVDRYNDTLVVQCNTAGMDQLQDRVIAALKTVLSPRRILLRNDSGHRTIEGLPLSQQMILGDNTTPLQVQENGAIFSIPLLEGQKTGWFYDHRDNRRHLLPFVKQKTVLDVFSYLGGWAIAAACAGAKQVTCIDSSKTAISTLTHNAQLNDVADKITAICDDAFDAMITLIDKKQHFDIVIIDPPAFIKSKKDKPAGMRAYEKLNRLALQLVSTNGLMVSASCSMHLLQEDLLAVIQQATHKTGSDVSILAQWHQSLDHPIHPMIPETNYLKAMLCHKR